MDNHYIWQDIWNKKGNKEVESIHLLDGFEMITAEQYDNLVAQTFCPLLPLNKDSRILELCCGAGAYLNSIQKQFSLNNLYGADYSDTLLKQAQKNTNILNFSKVDVINENLPYKESYFDLTFSFGATMYFHNYDKVIFFLNEMYNATKENGKIFIGEVSNPDKQDIAENIRDKTHKNQEKLNPNNPTHLWIEKELFLDFAKKNNCSIEIVDGDRLVGVSDYYRSALYRYNVYMVKNAG